MACIVVSRTVLVVKGEGDAGIVVATVEILMFPVNLNFVLVEEEK